MLISLVKIRTIIVFGQASIIFRIRKTYYRYRTILKRPKTIFFKSQFFVECESVKQHVPRVIMNAGLKRKIKTSSKENFNLGIDSLILIFVLRRKKLS